MFDALVELPPRDLGSLLMAVLAARVDGIAPGDLLAQQERVAAFAPGTVDPRAALVVAQAAFEAAGAFEAVELAPVVPLGAATLLAGAHANNVLTASRNAELVADPTLSLALLAALRRRPSDARARPLRLCALHRVMRMQPPPMAGLLPHFRIFGLVTADRRGGEDDALREHIGVHLRLFRLLGDRGHRFEDIAIDVAHTGAVAHRLGEDRLAAVRREVRTHRWVDRDELAARYGLEPLRGRVAEVLAGARLPAPIERRLERIDAAVLAPLARAYPEARLRLDLTRLAGLGYYDGPCLRIDARAPDGAIFNLCDGGFLPWTGQLLSDRGERLLSTGLGADLVCAKFAAG